MASFAHKDRSAGRSKTMISNSYDPARTKLTLSVRSLKSTSSLPLNDDHTTGGVSPMSPQETRRSGSRTNLRRDTMLSHTSTTSLNKAPHAKLHKRASSGGSSSPYSSTFPTPFATYEEPSTDTSKDERSSSATKLKSHRRKSSAAKGDQGMIDLSKSAAENEKLAGLGILQDFSAKPVSDVNFTHSRRQVHGRNASNASQGSTGSATLRPGQPFTHPMAKTPRPYTPPTGASHATLLDNEEAEESEDVVEDEFRPGNGFRSRRSMSITSAGYAAPTPLSQTYSAGSIALAPKHSISQSNLSIMSSHSDMVKPIVNDTPDPSPPSRTSIDIARSFVSRRSETEPQSREELIRAARKKFEEKEASKTKKDQRRRERQRQKSISESRPHVESKSTSSSASSSSTKPETTSSALLPQSRRKSSANAGASREEEKEVNNEKLHAKSYEDYRPANAASLPIYGNLPGESEKRPMQHSVAEATTARKAGSADHNWLRFSTWVQTRMLSCGDRN